METARKLWKLTKSPRSVGLRSLTKSTEAIILVYVLFFLVYTIFS